MTKNFDERDRYTEAEARQYLTDWAGSNATLHLLKNDDGTFSIMSHINCEWCDYCDERGDARGEPNIEPCVAKPNAYELQGR